MKHLERLHRQRSARAVGQSRDAGRMLLALVLLGIILGVLLAVPGQTDVHAWVHQVSHSFGITGSRRDAVGTSWPVAGTWIVARTWTTKSESCVPPTARFRRRGA